MSIWACQTIHLYQQFNSNKITFSNHLDQIQELMNIDSNDQSKIIHKKKGFNPYLPAPVDHNHDSTS